MRRLMRTQSRVPLQAGDMPEISTGHTHPFHDEDAMSKWQPIETAPKDGTAILGFWNCMLDGKSWTCYAITRFDEDSHEWTDIEDKDDYFSEPTHWQPLPEPPTP